MRTCVVAMERSYSEAGDDWQPQFVAVDEDEARRVAAEHVRRPQDLDWWRFVEVPFVGGSA